MERGHSKSVKAQYISYIDALPETPPPPEPLSEVPSLLDERDALASALYRVGLQRYQVDILIDRFVDDASFRIIAQKYGFVSHSTVWEYYQDAISYLKSVGFTLPTRKGMR